MLTILFYMFSIHKKSFPKSFKNGSFFQYRSVFWGVGIFLFSFFVNIRFLCTVCADMDMTSLLQALLEAENKKSLLLNQVVGAEMEFKELTDRITILEGTFGETSLPLDSDVNRELEMEGDHSKPPHSKKRKRDSFQDS